MHRLSSAFVLGYHGCDKSVAERVLAGEAFNPSENDYDWLGHGIYFWEANPARGLDFITEAKARRAKTGIGKPVAEPYVIGAAIDLGFCLDLLSSNGASSLAPVHKSFLEVCKKGGTNPPVNDLGADLLRRGLDCSVINHLHQLRKDATLPSYDSVRGVFIEGDPIYDTSGFRLKTHIQICVRNSDCIKGVFRVPEKDLKPS